MSDLRPGMVFAHRRFISIDRTPARFRITKVARGWFYYAAVDQDDSRAAWKHPVANAAEVVREVVA